VTLRLISSWGRQHLRGIENATAVQHRAVRHAARFTYATVITRQTSRRGYSCSVGSFSAASSCSNRR